MQHPGIVHLCALVRSLHYVVTTHAAEEFDDDHLTILDRENVVLTGRSTERQRDRQTHEIKCVIRGITLDGALNYFSGASGQMSVKIKFLTIPKPATKATFDDW